MNRTVKSTQATPTLTGVVFLGYLSIVGCASIEPVPEPENITVSEAEGESVQPPAPVTAANPDVEPEQAFIDRKQQLVANVVNNTAFWFDGLFATSEIYPQDAMTSGRILLGSRWDERDGLKNRIRIGLRVPLPALRKRAKLIVGRADTDDLLDGTESTEIKAIPDKFNDTKDEDWFLGLGYRQKSGLASGFDAGVGVTFASGTVQPYVQANYRWNMTIGDDWLLRVRPRAFWRDDRGRGASLTTILDYFLSRDWLLRSWNVLVAERNTEGVRWTGKLLAYQSLAGRSAFSYSLFVTGQTEAEVDVDDYGLEVRYRRSIYREWIFLELSTGVSWPRDFLVDPRDRNLAVGADVEFHFGGDK